MVLNFEKNLIPFCARLGKSDDSGTGSRIITADRNELLLSVPALKDVEAVAVSSRQLILSVSSSFSDNDRCKLWGTR